MLTSVYILTKAICSKPASACNRLCTVGALVGGGLQCNSRMRSTGCARAACRGPYVLVAMQDARMVQFIQQTKHANSTTEEPTVSMIDWLSMMHWSRDLIGFKEYTCGTAAALVKSNQGMQGLQHGAQASAHAQHAAPL